MFFGALLVGFVIVLAWRIEPLVSGVESAGLFKNPTISVGMVCRPSGGTVDLTYPIQIFFKLDSSSLFPLRGSVLLLGCELLNPALTAVFFGLFSLFRR